MWAVPSSPPQPGAGRGGSPLPGEVREGFLCPLCLKDLLSVQQLQAHYEEAHTGDEDGHMVGQIKTLFGRAKRKLLKREGSGRLDPEPQDLVYTGGIDPSKWEPQDLGATRNVRSEFQNWRGARINHYVIEVNKLLIRLEKLTAFDRVATDPAKKKALERSVVSWVSDRDVPCCPDCGAHFSITLRRHHCRLCGSIMCKRCTQFLTVHFAQQLTIAVRASVAAGGSPWGAERSAAGGESGRRQSVSSVGSLLEDSEDDRILSCQHCKGILERQERRLEERESSPAICQLYQKLRSCIVRVEELAPEYGKMADSLKAGESTFQLEQAVQLRMELMKLYERIDLLSKKIASLGMTTDPPPHPRSLQLQRMIRLSATHFLQEKLLGLTSLPSLERLQELKEERRRTDAGVPPAGQGSGPGTVDTDSGWLASASLPGRPSGSQPQDPLLEQIANIQCFLSQARGAGRQSEARALEENLGQLLSELEARRRREGPKGEPDVSPGPFRTGRGSDNAVPARQDKILANPFEKGARPADPFQEGPRRGDPFQERPRPTNPFEEGSCRGDQFQEGPRPANPFEEGLHPTNPFKEGPRPANPFKEGPRRGDPFQEGPHPANPEEGPRPGNPFEEGPRPGNPFEEGEREVANPFGEEEEEEERGEIEEELLRQQIDNIKAYVFDAKRAGRLDEVASLMDNLGELRQALERQRSGRRPL